MRALSDTLAKLKRLRPVQAQSSPRSTRLQPFGSFGSNPGQLKAWIHVPAIAAPGAPLVVVLHGCTQDAGSYDESAGWSRLADRHGFIVLYPEQQRSNNPNLCFNWFSSADAARGQGEALSIRQMVAAVHTRHRTDAGQVFVTGLSAGGAMTAAMLAAYPDVFAGGAVIAGLPFGVATSVPEAFDRMRGHGGPLLSELPDLVRAASAHTGPWPRLSVWHGTADQTVDHSNAVALIEQWRPLHGAARTPTRTDTVNGYPHRVWTDANGREVVEQYSINGLGHGTPLDVAGSNHGETPAPFMLDAGISSTGRIANFWGIIPEQAKADAGPSVAPPAELEKAAHKPAAASPSQHGNVQKTIEDALRSAGLMN